MISQLISQDEVEAMPEEPRQRFVAIEALCRKRLAERTQGEQEWANVVDERVIYMSTIIAAAKWLKVEPFASMDVPRRRAVDDTPIFSEFIQDIQFYVTQLMLEAAEANARTSIVLEGATRQRLQTLVAHLREQVQKLDLPSTRRDRLNARIDAFEKELEGARLRIFTVGVFALAVCGGVSAVDGAGTAIAKLVHEIQEVIGEAKERQDAEAAASLPVEVEPRRLEPPRKADTTVRATAGRKKASVVAVEDFSRGADFDDEIPF